MSDSPHTIMRSATRFFSGTMISRVTGMFRDMAMAFAFGTQETIAGFMVAFRFAHLLRRLFGEGALQTAFIPQFESLRKESPERAALFFRDLSITLSFLLLGIIVVISSGLWAVLTYMNLSAGNREILYLTLLMMPSLLFICLFGLNASLLQCEKSYFTPGVAPVAFNVIWIAIVLCLTKIPEEQAMPWLAIGVIIACISQWLFTVPSTLAFLRQNLTRSLLQNWKLASPDLCLLITPLFLGMFGVAAAQINNALDALFARYADGEGPAFLWYAIRIQQLPLALFGIAISGALLPPLSRAIKSEQWDRYQFFLNFALKRSLALMVPITLGILVMGDTCVNLLYGRGDFISESIVGTTRCLWAYGLGLIPMTLVLVFAPAFYARSNYSIPTKASLGAVGINIALNAWFVMGLGWGATSVALATSASAWCNAVFLGIMLQKQTQNTRIDYKGNLLKILTASLAAAFAVLTWRMMSNTFLTLWKTLIDDSANFNEGLLSQVSQFSIEGAIFCGTLGAVAWLIKAEDFLFLKKVEFTSS